MIRTLAVFLFGAFLFTGNPIVSADETSEAFKRIAALGPGVHQIQKDGKGRIVSCVVVGQARISTVLGSTKGIQTARQKAELATSGEFVKWLNEKVSVTQSSDEETIILTEGTENNGNETTKESGKSVEKNSVKMQSISEGLVRGLQVLYTAVDGEGKTYTIVKGWNTKNSKAVARVKDDIENPSSNSKKVKAPMEVKKVDKEIQSKTVVSDEAADFLKKDKKN